MTRKFTAYDVAAYVFGTAGVLALLAAFGEANPGVIPGWAEIPIRLALVAVAVILLASMGHYVERGRR